MWRRLPVIRAAVKLGPSGLLRVIALVVLVVSVGWVVGPYRPDLRDPASIGSDSSNYYAAGQRLNAGHHLYMLGSGDRPVANGTAPSPWSVPLLSPPPIAVVWRVLALLPGDASMYLWWASGAIASLLFYVLLILRLPARQLSIAILLAPCLSITAVSGNVNAFLIPISGAVWSLGIRNRSTVAGAIVGMMGAIKLAPALFLWWFICERKDRAVISTVATLVVATAVTILGAGLAAIATYPAVAAEANSVGLGPFSPTMVALAIGVPGSVAPIAPYGIAIASCLIASRSGDGQVGPSLHASSA